MSVPRSMSIPITALVGLQLACAAGPRPITGPYATADSITETEIQQELQSISGRAYPVLFLFIGAPVGAVSGCVAGSVIAPADAEDYGPCIGGGLAGLVAGIAGGLVLGVHLSEKSRRTEAIRRIRIRRTTQRSTGNDQH